MFIGRHHDNGNGAGGGFALELVTEHPPIHASQQKVQQDQVRQGRLKMPNHARIGPDFHLIRLLFQQEPQSIGDASMILNDENPESRGSLHGSRPGSPARVSSLRNVKKKMDPTFSWLLTQMLPPCRLTISADRYNPKPNPGKVS